MASDVDVVRVTESELRKIADKLKKKGLQATVKEVTLQNSSTDNKRTNMENRKRKETKRPTMTFYQPGKTRLSRRTVSNTSVPIEKNDKSSEVESSALEREDSCDSDHDMACTEVIESTDKDQKRKSKKPDLVRYTAPRCAAKPKDSEQAEEDKELTPQNREVIIPEKVETHKKDHHLAPSKKQEVLEQKLESSRKVALDQIGDIQVTVSSDKDVTTYTKQHSRPKYERHRDESTSSDISVNSSEDSVIPHPYEDWEAEMIDIDRNDVEHGISKITDNVKTQGKGVEVYDYCGEGLVFERREIWEEQIVDVPSLAKDVERQKIDTVPGCKSLNKKRDNVHPENIAKTRGAKTSGSVSQRRVEAKCKERPHENTQRESVRSTSEKVSSSDDHKKGKLTVTFDTHIRKVNVPPEDYYKRPDRKSKAKPCRTSNDRSNDGHSDHSPVSPTAKGGGIIHLPHNVSLSSSPTSPHDQIMVNRGRGRGRTKLWDPNKPQPKTASNRPNQQPLQFHDPEFDRHLDSERFSREPDMPYSSYNHREYYAHQQQQQQHPQQQQSPGYSERPYVDMPPYMNQGWYPPYYGHEYGYPVPGSDTSWANQMDTTMPYYPPYGRSMNYREHRGDGHSEIASQRVKSRNRESAQRLFHQVVALEAQLSNILSRRFHAVESINTLFQLRTELEQVYEGIILLDVTIAEENKVEQQLWKNSYYQIIEAFRKQATDEECEALELKDRLLKLINQGTIFFESLISKLQDTYSFKINELTGLDPLQNISEKSCKLAVVHVQKCMIYIGDLARYKEQTNETSNYGRARSWYLKAQQIAPKNGKPYNQLAILAVYTRRKLDAVYYYMRSLASTNSFGTARESLMSLFEEARRKVEHIEKKRHDVAVERKKEKAKRQNKNFHGDIQNSRHEIWVSRNGVIKSEETTIDDNFRDDVDLTKLSPVELNKRFVLSFLHVHGKLFTKIGMEKFPEVAHSMLDEFQTLLQHCPSPLGNTRLLQLMAINMFAIRNTALRDPASDCVRSFIQEQAIQLGLDMFGLVVSRCVELLKENDSSFDNKNGLHSDDLHEYLPSIKIWTDWMVCHPQLWNPPPDCCAPEHSISVDVWLSLAEFANLLKAVDISKVTIIQEFKEGYDSVVVPEDVMMSGFVPLLSLSVEPHYIDKQTDMQLAEDCVRISQLLLFCEYLCGVDNPLLAYSVEKHCYISIGPTRAQSEKVDNEKDLINRLSQEDDDDVIIESSGDEGNLENTDATNIGRLRAQKDALTKRVKEVQRREQHIKAVVDRHSSARPIELEVHPVHLVPDTNCFIDHLKGIKSIVACTLYTLEVPLVVINELDGLAKGSREGQFADSMHAQRVQEAANAAVSFLEDEFERYNNRMRAVTSRGSVLDTIAFRSEDPQGQLGNNDDIILSCCLFYCDDKARSFMPHNKDDPIKLHREVVLLTDDRNLRVKAHTRNVPTKTVPNFLQWADLVKR